MGAALGLANSAKNRAFTLSKRTTAIAGLAGPKQLAAFATAGVTHIMRREAEESFDRVRFHIQNFTDSDVTDLKMVCGATESDAISSAGLRSNIIVGGTGYTALGATDDAPGWLAVKFNGASTGVVPARRGGAAAYRPGVLTSDWVACSSIPRADGGSRPLIMLRAYSASALTVLSRLTTDLAGGGFNAGNLQAWNNASANSWYRSNRNAVTGVVDGVADLTQTGSASNSGPAIMVEFAYRRRAECVLGIGDSLLGLSDSGVYSAAGFRACAGMAALGIPAHYINYGDFGELSAVFQAPGYEAMTLFRPTKVLHHLYTPNDGSPNTVRIGHAMGRLRSVLARAAELGIRVVVRSATPNSGWDATADGFRLALNAQAAALAADGQCMFADLEAAVSDGATPARLKVSVAADGTHLNDTGLDLEAAILRPLFQQL